MPNHSIQDPDGPTDILLVEDNPGDIRLIQEAFKSLDSETAFHTVTNGDNAIDWLQNMASQNPDLPPDIALVDLNLPGRDGSEVLKAIRADSQLGSLPVIILTSSSASEDVERCYQANANAYLTKPVDPDGFELLAEKVGQFWFEKAELPPIPA